MQSEWVLTSERQENLKKTALEIIKEQYIYSKIYNNFKYFQTIGNFKQISNGFIEYGTITLSAINIENKIENIINSDNKVKKTANKVLLENML